VDSPNSEWGPEHMFFIAESSAAILLEVRRLSQVPGGRCTLQIRALRPPTPADRSRAAACRALSDGDAAGLARTPAGRRLGLAHYAKAASTWHSLGDLAEEAITETKLGTASSHLGDLHSAVGHWEQALTLLRQRALEDTLPALRNDLGNGYRRLGDAQHAFASFEAARDGARRRGDRREEAAALNNLGNLAQGRGEPWSALALLDQALAAWREVGDKTGEAATLESEGVVYTVLGKLTEARETLEEAAALFRSTGGRSREGLTVMALGWVRFLQGDAAAARHDLLHSLSLERDEANAWGEAVTLDRLGLLARETGRFEEAAADHQQALAIFRRLGDRQSEAIELSNLGLALTLGGHPAAGRRTLDSALALLAPLGQPSVLAYARFRHARAERALGRLEAARRDMEEGLAGLESIRERAQSDDLRMSYVDSIHDQFELLIDILMEMHARTPGMGFDRAALSVAESSHARSLLDVIAAAHQLSRSSRDSSADRLRRVDERIRAAQAAPQPSPAIPAAGEPPGAESPHLRALLAEREKVRVEIRQAPGAAKAPALQPLATDDIRARVLDPETVLLFYSLGESRSFVWALTADGVASAVLPPRSVLEAAALRLHDLLARSHLRRTLTQERLTARELSRLLLAPVASALAHRRIAVVADGILAYIPFGVLPEPGGDDAPLLFASREVVALPSASALAAIRERAARRVPARGLLAILADPLLRPVEPDLPATIATSLSTSTTAHATPIGGRPVGTGPLSSTGLPTPQETSVTRTVRDLGLQRLEPLPYSRREAEDILTLVPRGQGLGSTGAGANRAFATGGTLEHYRILHLATHALIHPSSPELSGIVLSATDERGRPHPDFLRSFEISDLRLPADLVVLSACRTGLGRELRGEGLLGLTQSFFEAGATRLVVSLWDVDDRATSVLMALFYRELLGAGRPPAEALRRAQLALREDPQWAAPYYWAGFELQGDWRPLH
jgi:CHAT domain-containing protein/tetratricopeptide (TPR) repeat protein